MFHIQPEETILPEPERNHSKMRLSSSIDLKSSDIRKAALSKMEHIPVNSGIRHIVSQWDAERFLI